jgi:hypothetical protein
MAVNLSALRTGRCFTRQKHYFYASCTHFCWRFSKFQGLVLPEGLGKLIKIIHLIGSRTCDLPVCNSALTTTLRRAPNCSVHIGITAFLNFVHRPEFWRAENSAFPNWICFRTQVRRGRQYSEEWCLLGCYAVWLL